jgi:O-antigen/teichoic acid export membrane protein
MDIHIINLFKKITSSHFVKNITIVMSGTMIAQALGFSMSPVISRLYSTTNFGIYGSFISFVGIISAVATLEYSSALILPKKNEEAFCLFIFSCICTFIISIISLFIYLFVSSYINRLLQSKSIWILVPVMAAIIVTGLNQSF